MKRNLFHIKTTEKNGLFMKKENSHTRYKPSEQLVNKNVAKESFLTLITHKSMKKRFLLASISAIVVGSIFGFIMLHLFGNEENKEHADVKEEIRTDSSNDEKLDLVDRKRQVIPMLEAYVLQAGVFLEDAHLNQMIASYKKAGKESVIWKKGKKSYLFVGLAPNETLANKQAATLANQNLETYVKKWSTSEREVLVTDDTYTWLMDFQQAWNEAMQSIHDNQALDKKQWESLYDKQGKQEELSRFIDETGSIVEQIITDPKLSDNATLYLLELWMLFDKLLQSLNINE